MDINEIINYIPYLTKDQLYRLYSEATVAIKQIEEAEQKRREKIHRRQVDIVDEMNKLLREFHTLSVSLSSPDAGNYMVNYANCFIDGDYDYPVFGFTIDQDNDISVSVCPSDDIAEWYRKEKKEREERKKGEEG